MPSAPELELRDYFRVIVQRKWLIVAATLVVFGAAYGSAATQTPIYRATAEVLLQPRTTESIFDPSVVQNLASGKQAPTEMRVVLSDPVVALVEDGLAGRAAVSVSNPSETDFLLVSAESPDPELAASVATAYARAYTEFRRQQAISDLEKAGNDLSAAIDEIDTALSATDSEAVPADLRGQSPESLASQRDFYTNRLQQIGLAIQQKTGGAQLQTPASVPGEPVRPNPRQSGLFGLVVGLALGIGFALLFDYLDDRIRSKEDLERVIVGLPILGIVPHMPPGREQTAESAIPDPTSPAAEAYRALRTSIQFMGVERQLQTIQLTSPAQREGKSTTVANLGVALAQAGETVTLLDCDLRRPRLHAIFDLRNDVGLTSVLIREAGLLDALVAVPGVPNLYVLPSGPLPPNPSELLAGRRMAEILEQLGRHGRVLIDCPPVLPVTDAVVLAGRVDGTLLIAAEGQTRQKALRRAREVLDQVAAPTLGTVFNGATTDEAYGYRYGRYRYAEPRARGRVRDALPSR